MYIKLLYIRNLYFPKTDIYTNSLRIYSHQIAPNGIKTENLKTF